MNELICKAIGSKNLIQFFYDGGMRVVEPHCHGNTTAGNPGLRAFQVRGYSVSGGTPDWRLFDMSLAGNVTILDEKFSSARSGYKRGDKGMSHIFCQL